MKEYAVTTLMGIGFAFCIDIICKTQIYKSKKFWIFQFIGFLLTAVVDHISSSFHIVLYDQLFVSSLRIYDVPIEHFLFGFTMLYVNIILFAYLKGKNTYK